MAHFLLFALEGIVPLNREGRFKSRGGGGVDPQVGCVPRWVWPGEGESTQAAPLLLHPRGRGGPEPRISALEQTGALEAKAP